MNVEDMRDKTYIDVGYGHTVVVWRSNQTGTWRGHMRDEEKNRIEGTYMYGFTHAHYASRAIMDRFNEIHGFLGIDE